MTTTATPQYQTGDRVSFVAVTGWDEYGAATAAGDTLGIVTRAHWGKSGRNITVKTDDGRTFVRYADDLRRIG